MAAAGDTVATVASRSWATIWRRFPISLRIGLAILLAQARHGGIQQRSDLPPDIVPGFIQNSLHVRLLFAAVTPGFASHKIAGGQPGGLKQPTGKRFVMAQLDRLSCEQDKDRLRNFLRLMRIADVPQCHGINQIDVPSHQRGKRSV